MPAEITQTPKQRTLDLITRLPEDSTYDQILQELALDRMIEAGLDDFEHGRTISHEEVRREVATWGS
jgi:predicted transcriptional regulator